MTTDEDILRRAFQSAWRRRATSGRSGCPSLENLFLSMEPDASRRLKNRVADHLGRCPACFEEFQFLRPVYARKQQTLGEISRCLFSGPEVPAFHIRIRRRRSVGILRVGVPVLLAILAALTIILKFEGPRSSSFPPAAERGAFPRSLNLLVPLEGQMLDVEQPEFRWDHVRGADSYRFELYDETLTLVWESPELFEPVVVLPPETAAVLKKGKKYFWMVGSKNSDGTRLESRLRHFVFGRPSE